MAENTKIIISAVDKTKKGFRGVTNGLKTVTNAVFSMKSALGLAAGGAAMGLLIKKSVDVVDSLDKTASKIGVTTQALTKMRYAAGLTGVATTTMDMALQRFTRRTAEAARGTGEAKGALQKLGLDATELIKMPLEERMLALSDAFSQQTNEAEKLALAFKLFDSEGAALVNTLKLGRDGLKEMFKEAESLGIVLSTTAVKGIVKAKDAISKLFTLFSGVRDQMTAALAPALEKIANLFRVKIVEAIEKADGSIEKFAQETVKKVIVAIGTMVEKIGASLTAMLQNFNDFFAAFSGSRVGGWLGFTEKVDNFFTNDLGGRISDQGKKIREWGESMDFMAGSAANGSVSLEPQIDIFKRWGEALTEVTGQFPSLDVGMRKVANTASSAMTKGFTDAITGAEKFSDAMKKMAKSVIDSLIEMLVQYYITQQIFGAITSMFPTGNKSLTNGSSNMQGNLDAANAAIGGRAIGGSVQAGQNYMVGERGAEMFVPNQSGAIIPNDKLGGGGGGVVVNQTINITTGIQSTVRAEIASLMPQIAQAAKGAVVDARSRGGNFSKAMGA